MTTEPKSFPVKYMVVESEYTTNYFDILDTSVQDGYLVAESMTIGTAHKIAKFLNESEGYKYEY